MVTLHILREGETQPATWLSWGSKTQHWRGHNRTFCLKCHEGLLDCPWPKKKPETSLKVTGNMVTFVNDWTTGTSSGMPSHPKSSSPKRQGNGEEILNQSYQRPEIGALSDVLRLSLCQCQTNLGINHLKPCPNWKTLPTWGQPVHKLTHDVWNIYITTFTPKKWPKCR